MKASEIRQKKNDELLKMLNDSYESLRDYRFQASVRKLKNTNLIRATRKDIARILTILIERNETNEE